MITLVTGAAGFIGSHLCDALVARGDRVIGIDDLRTGRVDNLADLQGHPRFEFLQMSAADGPALEPVVARSDRVMHLAASVGVGAIIDDPAGSMENNLSLATTVSRVAADHRTPLLVTSSSEVYGRAGPRPIGEDDDRTLGPTHVARWSYATAKAAEESMARAHGVRAVVPVTIARLFNTVGPRQSPHYGMVLPRFVRAALAGAPLEVFGDGRQTRCFVHVADVVDALVRLVERPGAEPLTVNVGGTEPVAIVDLATRVVAACGSKSAIEFVDPRERYGHDFDEPRDRLPDIGRIHAATGWRPSRSLDSIIADTVAAHLARQPLTSTRR